MAQVSLSHRAAIELLPKTIPPIHLAHSLSGKYRPLKVPKLNEKPAPKAALKRENNNFKTKNRYPNT